MNKEKLILKLNCIVLIFNIIISNILFLLFESIESIAVALLITYIFWYYIFKFNLYVNKREVFKNVFWEILLYLIYIIVYLKFDVFKSTIIFFICIIFIFILNKKKIKNILKEVIL